MRLYSLLAADFWQARNTLTQRAIGPLSVPTVELEIGGLKPGDIAGLGLLDLPYAWIGVRCESDGNFVLEQFDKTTDKTTRVPLKLPLSGKRIWLRTECNFFTEKAQFSYSTNGKTFTPLGEEFKMVFQLKTFQGVRYSLFHYNTIGVTIGISGGYADFARFTVEEPIYNGLTKPIPYRKTVEFYEAQSGRVVAVGAQTVFKILDLGQGRVALETAQGFVSVPSFEGNAPLTLKRGKPTEAETFQWIETPQGEITLLSLLSHRYLHLSPESGQVLADHLGPQRNQSNGPRLVWKLAGS